MGFWRAWVLVGVVMGLVVAVGRAESAAVPGAVVIGDGWQLRDGAD
jgi:hypothetical protein